MRSKEKGEQRYTLSILTENTPGVLHRITSVFTRRSVNIESLTVSETERHGVSRFTIVFFADAHAVDGVVKPIQRIVEVLDAIVHEDQDLLFKEIAFARIAFASREECALIEARAEEHGAHVVLRNGQSIVFEKSGREDEIEAFKTCFQTHRVLTFIRSGRIAIDCHLTDMREAPWEDPCYTQPN